MAFAAVFLLVFVFPLLIILYFWNRSQFFKRREIPGPTPTSIFTGNLCEIEGEMRPAIKLYEWEKKYGPIFGYFDGTNKVVVVSDLGILHDVFVKKFENFYERKLRPAVPVKESGWMHVFSAQGLQWKRLRAISNPSFTSNKLRMMEPTIVDSIQGLMDQFEKHNGQPFDIYAYLSIDSDYSLSGFQELTLDIIQRVALGKQDTDFGKRSIPHIDLLRKAFSPQPIVRSYFASYFASTGTEVPNFNELVDWATELFFMIPFKMIGNKLEKIIEKRRQSFLKGETQQITDFIELFLNAEANENDINRIKFANAQELDRKNIKVDKKLTKKEIVGQCIVFLLAGYDTTANTLGYLAYDLAINSRVRNKLVEEIDSYFSDEDQITYETMQKLHYLDWCLKESLRMNPLATMY